MSLESNKPAIRRIKYDTNNLGTSFEDGSYTVASADHQGVILVEDTQKKILSTKKGSNTMDTEDSISSTESKLPKEKSLSSGYKPYHKHAPARNPKNSKVNKIQRIKPDEYLEQNR